MTVNRRGLLKLLLFGAAAPLIPAAPVQTTTVMTTTGPHVDVYYANDELRRRYQYRCTFTTGSGFYESGP